MIRGLCRIELWFVTLFIPGWVHCQDLELPAGPPTFKHSDVAADAAAVALSRFHSAANQVKNIDSKIGGLKEQARKSAVERARLEAMKKKAMDDISRGEICSGCNQTRTEIEAKGQRFPHEGEHIVYMSPTAIAAKQNEKAREFDNEIAREVQQQAYAEAQVRQMEQQRPVALQETKENMARWLNAIRQEGPLLASEFNAQKSKTERVIQDWKKLYQTLDQMEERARHPDTIGAPGHSQVGVVNQQQINQIEEQKQALGDQIRAGLGQNQRLSEDYQVRQVEWANKVVDGRKAFEDAAGVVGMFTMPQWNAPELKVGALGWNFTVGNDKIEMSMPLGSAKSSIKVADDWLNNSMSVGAMLEGSYGGLSGGVGMKRTTTWGPNGVTTSDEPIGKASVFGQPVSTWMEGGTENKK